MQFNPTYRKICSRWWNLRPPQPVSDLPLSATQRLPLQLQRGTHHSLPTGPVYLFCFSGTAVTKVQRCSLFFPRTYMSQRRRQTFVLGLLFLLFGDLISAEIETPTWPAATGEMNTGKYAVSWLLTYTTAVTVYTKFTTQACACIYSLMSWLVEFVASQPTYVNIFHIFCNVIRYCITKMTWIPVRL